MLPLVYVYKPLPTPSIGMFLCAARRVEGIHYNIHIRGELIATWVEFASSLIHECSDFLCEGGCVCHERDIYIYQTKDAGPLRFHVVRAGASRETKPRFSINATLWDSHEYLECFPLVSPYLFLSLSCE